MKEYLIGPFFWWYTVIVVNIAAFVRFRIYFLLIKTKTLPMIKAFTMPLFGDTSGMGKFLGAFIRSFWILFGSIFVFILSMPYIVFLVFVAVLPILPILIILL